MRAAADMGKDRLQGVRGCGESFPREGAGMVEERVSTILHILQHALGRDEYGQTRSRGGHGAEDYRNHYVAGEGHHSFALCRQAVSNGLMIEHPPSDLSGGDCVFVATEAGKEYITKNSPRPPKLTRGQKRYRKWLDGPADFGVSFGDYLKRGDT